MYVCLLFVTAVVVIGVEECEIRSWVFVFETWSKSGRHEPGLGVNRLIVDPPQQSVFRCN
jgi:hypothetical protein